MKPYTNKTTESRIEIFLSDNKLLQELYAVQAMIDGMDRAYYQPQYKKRDFQKAVVIEIQNKINKLAREIEFRMSEENAKLLNNK